MVWSICSCLSMSPCRLSSASARFVAQRARLLEAVTPLRRAADVYGQSSAVITERLAESHCYLRAEVETAFAPELDSSGAYTR